MAPPKTNILQVDILRTVKFDGFNNTILFEDKASRDSYFDKKVLYTKWYDEEEKRWKKAHIHMNGSYQRKQWIMRLNQNYATIANDSNYLRYRNFNENDENNKYNENNGNWIYCFITNIEWINPNDCEITFMIDPIMTYINDVVWKPCLVEREHTIDDDNIDYELEDISFSQYIERPLILRVEDDYITSDAKKCFEQYEIDYNTNLTNFKAGYIIEATQDLIKESALPTGGPYYCSVNGITSQLLYLYIPNSTGVIDFLDAMKKAEADLNKIKNIYSIPQILLCNLQYVSGGLMSDTYSICGSDLYIRRITLSLPSAVAAPIVYPIFTKLPNKAEYPQPDFTAYLPPVTVTAQSEFEIPEIKNNKCKNSPFINLNLYSTSGKLKIDNQFLGNKYSDIYYPNMHMWLISYKFDLFWSPFNVPFNLKIAKDYKKQGYTGNICNSMLKIPFSVMPSHNAIADAQSQWWRENKFSIISNTIMGAASIAAGAGMLSLPAGLSTPQTAKGGVRSNNNRNDYEIMGGAASLLNTADKLYKASKLPDYEVTQLAGIDSYASRIPPVTIVLSHLIDDEFIQLDNYFSKFGYKVNKLKYPELFNNKDIKKTGAGDTAVYNANKITPYRERWQYLKLAESNIYGTKYIESNSEVYKDGIPYVELLVIKSILQSGITFWNYTDNIDEEFGDYTLENGVKKDGSA